ncbi:hypothetical protein SynROS8604_00128 [Synechococcus sp. ROS8604]|nr:hypothetical protein SynROS8604_00128 [Synechococcus sp. ROS8604]
MFAVSTQTLTDKLRPSRFHDNKRRNTYQSLTKAWRER